MNTIILFNNRNKDPIFNLNINNLNNYISYYKKGNKIRIKEKNKGSFTKYCNGKVTNECIQKAKNSGNPKLVKKAVFA